MSQLRSLKCRWEERTLLKALRADTTCRSNRTFATYLCNAGLGNRLQAHICTHVFALQTDRDLVVNWVRNGHLGAHFEDLFEIRFPSQCGYESCHVVRASEHKNSAHIEITDCCADLVAFDSSYCPFDTETLVTGPDAIPQLVNLVLRQLSPVSRVSSHVKGLSSHFPRPVVGVHIRRGDWCDHGVAVGLERYVTAVHTLQSHLGSRITCYVSSDAASNQLMPFLTAYDCIHRPRSPKPRGSIAEAEDALVDMLLLSRCDYLVRTRGSSFSNAAAIIGQMPTVYA